jgi:methylated-DNA-[protein]-cysteine S-methyltransferase
MISGFYYETKLGKLGIVEDGEGITHVFFGEITIKEITLKETTLLKEAKRQLDEYLDGNRQAFQLKLKPEGTEFRKKVWGALLNIPYGKTVSYKDIAKAVGNEKAARAVGMANNKNPIPIFIPCHRVIGSNGDLVGYAGGLDIKKKLLNLEVGVNI